MKERERTRTQAEASAVLAETLVEFVLDVEPRLYSGTGLATELDRVESELHNLRAAMSSAYENNPGMLARVSFALSQFWLRRSMLDEGGSMTWLWTTGVAAALRRGTTS